MKLFSPSFSCLLLVFLLPFSVCAQNNIVTQWDSLSAGDALPEELLSGKSLLIFKTLPDLNDPNLRADWLPMADEVQPYLQRSGIDAVATYHINDIASGKETSEVFLYLFNERQITHLVLVEQQPGGFAIRIANFDREHLVDTSAPAWYTFGANLRTAANQVYLAASQSGQKFSNRLILSVPEKGSLPSPINGRRSEFYDLNLQSEKLAVLPFTDTAAIRQAMTTYPYNYDFVDPAIPERELRSDGYQFILYYVHSTGESVRQMLEYPVDVSEDAYVSETFNGETPVAVTLDKERPVYKFYIKHIYSGNVFLGQSYDAAPTWQEALSYYIANLREELL